MQKRTKFQIRSDAAKQRWVRDERKEAYWRKQKSLWKASGLSKRAFCIANNISQSSFGAWCRELDLRDREKIRSKNAAELLEPPADVEKNPFVPLRILSGTTANSAPAAATNPIAHKERIEISIPNGAVLSIPDDCNVNLVAELYSVLKDIIPKCST